jgi:ORF6N domain
MGENAIVSVERIEHAILVLRGHKVMLDTDLALLYDVEPKALNRAVKRNLDRFPVDFMFQLTAEEAKCLRYQSGTLDKDDKPGRGQYRKYLPYAFTEQGVAMLSSVLRSPRAVQVNIEIMRAFVRLRLMLQQNADLARKLALLEKKYDAQFRAVFDAIRELMKPPEKTRRRIGFESGEAAYSPDRSDRSR